MRKMRSYITDEYGNAYDYADAAQRLGVTPATLRVKLCLYRKAHGDVDEIRLDDLRPSARALTVEAVDDREDASNTNVFTLSITAFAKRQNISRATMFRRVREHRLQYPGMPISLKYLERAAHSTRARARIRHNARIEREVQ